MTTLIGNESHAHNVCILGKNYLDIMLGFEYIMGFTQALHHAPKLYGISNAVKLKVLKYYDKQSIKPMNTLFIYVMFLFNKCWLNVMAVSGKCTHISDISVYVISWQLLLHKSTVCALLLLVLFYFLLASPFIPATLEGSLYQKKVLLEYNKC